MLRLLLWLGWEEEGTQVSSYPVSFFAVFAISLVGYMLWVFDRSIACS